MNNCLSFSSVSNHAHNILLSAREYHDNSPRSKYCRCWRTINSTSIRQEYLHSPTTNSTTRTLSASSATHIEPPPAPSSFSPPDPQRIAEARVAFTAHLLSIGNSHISSLAGRVSEIRNNFLAISKQEADLAKNIKKLATEAIKKHQQVADRAAGKLKELGDIRSWAEVLKRDLLMLEETMKMGEVRDEGDEWESEGDGEGGEGGNASKVQAGGEKKKQGEGRVNDLEGRGER